MFDDITSVMVRSTQGDSAHRQADSAGQQVGEQTRPMTATVMPGADVDASATLGDGSAVWHLAQIRERAVLGTGCVVGRGAYVGPDVWIGDNVKIQNYALVYEPARLEDGVFVGPAAVLTNDSYPRSVDVDGCLKGAGDWDPVGVLVREGASVGAGAVCVAPVTIGRWALVGAAAVITRDVPDFALMVGAPARRVGWVGHAGLPLTAIGPDQWECPRTSRTYVERGGFLRESNR